MKVGKFVGYCNKCLLVISSFDKAREGEVYTCAGCGEENSLEKMGKDRIIEKPIYEEFEEEG